jgi:hypothetical protein
MSTANLAEIIQARTGRPAGGFHETVREIEAVKAVMFLFHPWMDLPNFGSEGFRFNLHVPVIERLTPVPVTTVPRVIIHAKQRGSFGLLGVSNFVGGDGSLDAMQQGGIGGMVPQGAGAVIERVQQRPQETVRDVLNAWGFLGMTHLASLDASDEAGALSSFDLYDAVMAPARNEDEMAQGRRPVHLVLEDFPLWLSQGAPRALEGFLRAVKEQASRKDAEKRGRALIGEVSSAISRAGLHALDPANGILPKTRRDMEARGRGGEGKTHLDDQDLWLLRQYPSFDMDSMAERAQRAVEETVRKQAESGDASAQAILALAGQVAKQGERTDRMLEYLVEEKKKRPAA